MGFVPNMLPRPTCRAFCVHMPLPFRCDVAAGLPPNALGRWAQNCEPVYRGVGGIGRRKNRDVQDHSHVSVVQIDEERRSDDATVCNLDVMLLIYRELCDGTGIAAATTRQSKRRFR